MEEDSLLFLEILDKESLDAYQRLLKIEDEAILSLEIWNIEQKLKEVIRQKQHENFNEGIFSLINSLIYQINCLLTIRRSTKLEEGIQLINKYRKVEKECLKLLKQSLIYSSKNLLDQEHNVAVFRIFLYMLVLHQISINRNDHRKQQYKSLEFYQKNVSVILPQVHGMDLSDNIKIVEKVKQYAIQLPKGKDVYLK